MSTIFIGRLPLNYTVWNSELRKEKEERVFSFEAVPGIMTQLTLVFLYLLYGVVCAVTTNKVLQFKGYEDRPGWVIAALFFGILILIGAAGLPLAKDVAVPLHGQNTE